MKDLIRTIAKVFLFTALLGAPASGQSLQSAPAPAVAAPAYDVSVGYANLMMARPGGAGHADLNGVDVSGSVALKSRWGVTVDSSYVRTSSVFDTPHQGYVYSVHAGPAFYPFEHRNTRVFIRGLAGAAITDGGVPINETHYFHGWLGRPSYVFGGGVEHAVSEGFGVRVGGDYLRTSFYDAAGAVQPQNSLQLTVSAVFRLRGRHSYSGQLR
jgi:hypothetical protein